MLRRRLGQAADRPVASGGRGCSAHLHTRPRGPRPSCQESTDSGRRCSSPLLWLLGNAHSGSLSPFTPLPWSMSHATAAKCPVGVWVRTPPSGRSLGEAGSFLCRTEQSRWPETASLVSRRPVGRCTHTSGGGRGCPACGVTHVRRLAGDSQEDARTCQQRVPGWGRCDDNPPPLCLFMFSESRPANRLLLLVKKKKNPPQSLLLRGKTRHRATAQTRLPGPGAPSPSPGKEPVPEQARFTVLVPCLSGRRA